MSYDALLVVAVLMIASMLIVIPAGDRIPSGNLAFQLYLLTVWFLYFAVCWRYGQTLGMKAWRIELTADSRPSGWSRLTIRFLVAGLSLAAVGAGLAWSLVDRQGRTWHDLASGTRLVVRSRKNAENGSKTPEQPQAERSEEERRQDHQ